MKRLVIVSFALAVFVAVLGVVRSPLRAQRGGGPPPPNQSVPILTTPVPVMPFDSNANFFKVGPDMNFGEILGVAVNSKGNIVVLNHPGSATTGPLYGNATTQLWEFDSTGKFIREIGKGVYGLGYAHAVRFDRYDNLWVVDKGTNAVVKFNPAGMVTLNLGRRPEGYDSFEYKRTPPAEKRAGEGTFDGPTDIGWDAADNIYVSDGYVNSRKVWFPRCTFLAVSGRTSATPA